MKIFITVIIFWLVHVPVFSQIKDSKYLVIAYDTVHSESCDHRISVYYKENSSSFQKIIETTNHLEYFEYLGKIYTDDGNEYHLFKDFSLPVGTQSLFYINTKDCLVYQLKAIQEYQYPMHFSFSSEQGNLKILSFDVNDCGKIIKREVADSWSGKIDSDKLYNRVPDTQKILYCVQF